MALSRSGMPPVPPVLDGMAPLVGLRDRRRSSIAVADAGHPHRRREGVLIAENGLIELAIGEHAEQAADVPWLEPRPVRRERRIAVIVPRREIRLDAGRRLERPIIGVIGHHRPRTGGAALDLLLLLAVAGD